ncbi:hypothetical protein Esti_000804 [Eimeria stiedai]
MPLVARGDLAATGPSEESWAFAAASRPNKGALSRPPVPAFGLWRQPLQQPVRRTMSRLRPQRHQRLQQSHHPLSRIWQQQPSQRQTQTLPEATRRPLLQRRAPDLGMAGLGVRPTPLSAVGSLQMNAIPHGSVLEQQMNELMQDPVKNMPVRLSCSLCSSIRFFSLPLAHAAVAVLLALLLKPSAALRGRGIQAFMWVLLGGVAHRTCMCFLCCSQWDIYVPFYKHLGPRLQGMQRSGTKTCVPCISLSTLSLEICASPHSSSSQCICVVDGGAEAYKGRGTSLPFHPLSLDRQHAVKWPQHHAHGVGFREAVDQPYNIRFDRLPDGNQDVYFGETDAELEARLWGSWDDPQGLHEYFPETGWRDTLPDEDITGMPRPWTHKQSDVLEFPPHHRDPSPGPPEIPLEVELAAAGMWRGYVLEPGWTRHAEAIAECSKAQQWRREEAEAPSKPLNKKTRPAATAKKQEKQRAAELLRRTQDIVKAHWADIRKHPVYVRAVVEGATHAAAAAAAAAASPRTAAEMALGRDIAEGLEMQETLDPLVQGQVNPPNAEGKTVAVNLALYSLSPFSCSYLSPQASVAEHEELYHYLMTENHREGRYTDFHLEIAATQDVEYRLRPRRQSFRRLMALYRPLWAKRKYGEEFGGPPKEEEEEAPDETFLDPAVSLHWPSRRSCSSSSSSPLPPHLSLPPPTSAKHAETTGRPRQTQGL